MPLSEAVASIDPVEFIERKEIGDLCAWMTFATVKVRVEKRMTSPDCCADAAAGGDSEREDEGSNSSDPMEQFSYTPPLLYK